MKIVLSSALVLLTATSVLAADPSYGEYRTGDWKLDRSLNSKEKVVLANVDKMYDNSALADSNDTLMKLTGVYRDQDTTALETTYDVEVTLQGSRLSPTLPLKQVPPEQVVNGETGVVETPTVTTSYKAYYKFFKLYVTGESNALALIGKTLVSPGSSWSYPGIIGDGVNPDRLSSMGGKTLLGYKIK